MIMLFKCTAVFFICAMLYFLVGLLSQNKKTLEFFEKLTGK